MIRIFLAMAFVAVSVSLAQEPPATKPIGKNRVTNGEFEKDSAGWPFMATNGCQASVEVVKTEGHDSAQSLKITNKSEFAPHVYGRVYQVIGGLDPFTTYRISCYVKGKNVGFCWIGGGPGWGHRQPFPKGTYDWTCVETLLITDATAGDYELMVATESPTEAAYVDDIKFEPLAVDIARRDAVLARAAAALAARQMQFTQVTSAIAATPGAAQDPVIHLGVAIARRYLDRISSFPPLQSPTWTNQQLDEIESILNETSKQIELFKSHGRTPQPLQFPLGGPVTIRDGLFYTDTSAGKNKPWFFYGMGHFSQIMRDLPFWNEMGATMVQDGRCGPSAMEADGSLRENARTLLADMSRAALYGVKTDFLLSPHYFPEWVWDKPNADEVREQGGLGFLYFNIDHPLAKDAIGRWADTMSAKLRSCSALLSVCLSNEPVYDDAGFTKQTLPLYRAYLADVHKNDIAALNALYGTSYKSFDEANPPPRGYAADDNGNRAFYDWQRFNKKHFADWHAWLNEIVKTNLPDIPTHAKIMVFFTMNREQMTYGVDPELFSEVTDLAGCDAYAFPAGDYKSYDWRGHEFWYDLLHSFRNQPVFNSENHIIPDGTGIVRIPMEMTRAQYWQGALHHQAVTTTWVWEEQHDPSLAGSIYFRPANAYGAGRAFVDLGRFADEVAAINNAPPRFALLYSQPSIFWEPKYAGTIQDFYTCLNFLGEKATFVSEKMLQTGRTPKVKCIVLTQATHVEGATVEALKQFVAGGGKVILVDEGNLAFDQYHRPRRNLPDELSAAPMIEFSKASVADRQQALFDLLTQQGLPPVELRDTKSGKLAWNVEYRVVLHKGKALVPMINFDKTPVTVKGPSSAGQRAIDLLSGEEISGDEPLTLEPMVPRLFRSQ